MAAEVELMQIRRAVRHESGRRKRSVAFGLAVVASVVPPFAPAAAAALPDSALSNAALQIEDEAESIFDDSGPMTEEEIRSSVANLVLDPQSIHPDVLAQVHFDLGPLGQVGEQLVAARIDLEAAQALQAELGPQARELRQRVRGSTRLLDEAMADEAAKSEVRDSADSALGEFAVATFVGYEAMELNRFSADVKTQALAGITDESEEVVVGAALLARAEHDEAVVVVGGLVEELADLNQQIEEIDAAFDVAEEDEAAAGDVLERLGPVLEAELLSLVVPGTDIPVVVLDAYYKAELRFAQLYPNCDVTWSHLAGIGKVESGHGSFGGSVVGADGRTSGRILGPQLNGDPFAAIADTDGGRLDGDAVWDRAVGPMQFIPSSWAIFRHDGNGDGVADPHNIYDAAQAAADHLCRSTSGLGARANFQRALLGYNRSVEYGLTVMGFTDNYQSVVGLDSAAGGLDAGPYLPEGPLTDPDPIEIDNPAELPDPPGSDGGDPETVIDNDPDTDTTAAGDTTSTTTGEPAATTSSVASTTEATTTTTTATTTTTSTTTEPEAG